MELNKWNKSHFCAYLLLSVAHADNDISSEEIISIKSYLNKIYEGSERSLDNTLPVFLEHSEDLRTNFIKTKWHLFFKTKEEIGCILDEIEEMILVDGKIDLSEIKTYGAIRKTLGICDYE